LANGAERVQRWFKGRQCRFSPHAKRTITATTIAAAGTSDWGVQSIIFGTLKAMVDEMRLNISHKQLARGCPSVTALRNWEFKLAGGTLAKVIHKIQKDAKLLMEKYNKKLQITLVTDHGNKKGFDHFVKMIVWSSKDKNGKNVLRHFNLDLDKGGHTTVEAANAISKSLKALHLEEVDVEFFFICGDSGGGASVQALHPRLIEIGAMPELSDFMNCILHAFNLAYESACKNSLGDQGMGKYSVFQMCFLAVLMLKTIKKQSDMETLKKYYNVTMTQLLDSDDYQAGAGENFIQAFEEMVSVVDEAGNDLSDEDLIGDDLMIDELINGARAKKQEEMKADCPTNIKEPNFGRWGTVSAVAKTVLKHWLPIFYMAQNVVAIESKKSGNSYLLTIATKLMELMTSRPSPNHKSPTHYTTLRWIVAFGDFMFDGNMEWVKRNDPVFGLNSYGHITRLVPEHLFVMKKQMDILKADDYTGWKSRPEFNGFQRALNGVSPMGEVSKCGLEFFERMPKLFLERFEEQLNEHTKKWRSTETLPVIIAGHPLIAKAYINWLFGKTETFPNKETTLDHHNMNGQTIKVNISECLLWLTERADPDEMLQNSLIQDCILELSEYAESTDDSIDLMDPETWGNYRFDKAYDLIWNAVGSRAAHQQRVENLVQTAGHLGKTHVEEARRSARAKIHCIFYRDFNAWALDIMRKRDEQKILKDLQKQQNQTRAQQTKIRQIRRRVDGKARLELFSQWIDEQNKEIECAEKELGEETMKTIMKELSQGNKSSKLDNEEKQRLFEMASKQSKSRVMLSKHLCDVTPWMEGSIILSFVSQKEGGRPYLMAEIDHRGIKYKPTKKITDMTKEEKAKHAKKFDGLTMNELKNVLRLEERRRLLEEEDRTVVKLSDVKTVKPLSDEFKRWMPKQWKIYKQRKGLVMDDNEENTT
jgi:hypothetical protein